jgi:hypothetical protein
MQLNISVFKLPILSFEYRFFAKPSKSDKAARDKTTDLLVESLVPQLAGFAEILSSRFAAPKMPSGVSPAPVEGEGLAYMVKTDDGPVVVQMGPTGVRVSAVGPDGLGKMLWEGAQSPPPDPNTKH